MVSEIIAFFLGLFTLFIGAFFRKNIEEAYKRKRIATKLESYLLHWSRLITESETGLNLLVVGKHYRDQREPAILNNDIDEYQKILEQQKKEIKDLFSEEKDEELNENIAKTIQQIREASKSEIDNALHEINELLEMVRNDKVFISDEEAAFLPWFLAGEIINLRLKADHILTNIRSITISIRNNDQIDVDEAKTKFTDLIWEFIELVQKIEQLISISKKIRQKNVLLEAIKPTK